MTESRSRFKNRDFFAIARATCIMLVHVDANRGDTGYLKGCEFDAVTGSVELVTIEIEKSRWQWCLQFWSRGKAYCESKY